MTFTDTTPTVTPTPVRHPSHSRGLYVGGVIAVALAGLALVGAAGLLTVHYGQRDRTGYYRSPAVALSSNGYAISSAGLNLGSLNGAEEFVANGLFERVRMSARTTTGKPIFIGLARQSDLATYLSGTARTVVNDVRDDRTAVTHDRVGGVLRRAPARQSFWRAQASGRGEVSIDWKIGSGRWALAVLNADGSSHTAADVRLEVTTDALLWIGLGLAGVSLLMGGGGAGMLVASRRTRSAGDGSGSAPDDSSSSEREA